MEEIEEETQNRPEGEEVEERGIAFYSPLQRYLAEIRKYPLLSLEEEKHLVLLSKATNESEEGVLQAIAKLVLSHLRLAAAIAMEYKHLPFDTMDLIQEGNVGLLQAIQKFDPARLVRVATYAAWWIRAYILRYILQNWRLVKIGTTVAQRKLFFALSRERERLEKLGYQVEPKHLADHFHVKEKDVIEVSHRLLVGHEVFLDDPVAPKGGAWGQDLRVGHQIPSQEEGIEQRLAEAQLADLFRSKLELFRQTLGPRDQDILCHRILADAPMTLKAFGLKYKISKERVRQLEANLVKRLKRFVKQEIKD